MTLLHMTSMQTTAVFHFAFLVDFIICIYIGDIRSTFKNVNILRKIKCPVRSLKNGQTFELFCKHFGQTGGQNFVRCQQ